MSALILRYTIVKIELCNALLIFSIFFYFFARVCATHSALEKSKANID